MKANKNDLHESGRPLTQSEFIERIKTDDTFNEKWGDLGRIYGFQWRKWQSYEKWETDFVGTYHKIRPTDQIQNLIDNLKTNPDSRRLLVNAWNVSDLDDILLPPCHYSFQVYTRELDWKERVEVARSLLSKEEFDVYGNISPFTTPMITYWLNQHNIPTRAISLMFNMRSNDVPLGLPFNIASYALLLKIIAKEVNMISDELIGSLADTHIYENQIDGVKEQISRSSFELPDIEFSEEFNNIMDDSTLTFSEKIEKFEPFMFKLKNYTSHPRIDLPLSN